jgi:hypothetical protein
MLGCPNAQPSLQRIIQTPYGNASHAINDSIAINACTLCFSWPQVNAGKARSLTGRATLRPSKGSIQDHCASSSAAASRLKITKRTQYPEPTAPRHKRIGVVISRAGNNLRRPLYR